MLDERIGLFSTGEDYFRLAGHSGPMIENVQSRIA
jgi:hypothetical protein